MKNQLLNLKMIALMCLMMVLGGVNVWAQETTVTSTFTNSQLAVGKGEPTWTASIISYRFENRGVQFGAGKGKFTISSKSKFTNVTKVSIVSSSNETGNTMAVSVGGSALGSTVNILKSNNKTYNFNGESCSGNIVINCNDKSKTIWIKSISITYSEKPSSPSSELTLSQTAGSVEVGKTIDLSQYVSTASGYEGTINYEVTEGAEFISLADGVVTGVSEGNASIKVTATEVADKFSESSQIFKLTVIDSRIVTNVSFGADVDNSIITVLNGEEESFVSPTASVKAGESSLINPVITYKSENPAVADVASDGTITFGSEYGTTKITANYAGDDTYASSSSYYIINHKKTLDASVIFYESFDKNDGKGGNDGLWLGTIAQNDLILDNSEWICKNEKGASKCAKFGSTSSKGIATTPSIDLSVGDAVLVFKAGGWDTKKESTSIIVSVDNGKLAYNGKVASEQTITLKKGEFSDYTMTISGGTSATKITFSAIQDNYNRFFLDEVMVSKVAAAEPTYTKQTPVTFRAEDNGDYYATFSNDKVTFVTSDNSEAYKIVVSDGNIVKTKLDEVAADINGETVKGFYIPANTGVLLYSIAKTADYYTVENKTVDAISPVDNMLKPAPKDGGVFAFNGGYKYYKLAYGDWTNKTQLGFYWGADNGGAFYVKAGTAYLAVFDGDATAKGFAFNGEATGIEGVNANVENAKAIYNLNGQRVASMAKPGLYIVNGKKVVRK